MQACLYEYSASMQPTCLSCGEPTSNVQLHFAAQLSFGSSIRSINAVTGVSCGASFVQQGW
jgi:hypothetical protein